MRIINRIILHCSDTPLGRKVSAQDIRRWHISRGWDDIGYHFTIAQDGTIEKGRKLETIGAHSYGQNRDSIGCCYIGGQDIHGRPANTMTPEQVSAFTFLCGQLCAQFAGLKLEGHNLHSAKACPGFKVSEGMPHLFNRMS